MKIGPAVFLVSVVLTAGAQTAFSQTSPKTCNETLFDETCVDQSWLGVDLRKTSGEADGVLFNYFLVDRLSRKEQLLKFGAIANSREQKRALEIAEDARKEAILFVSDGAPEKTWSNETKAIVERLRTVKFRNSAATHPDCYMGGDAGIPQAGYSPPEHAIGLCPGLTKIPTEQIANTVAHELGHVAGPCSMAKPLIEFTPPPKNYVRCRTSIGDGAERSAEDRELFGEGPIKIDDPQSGFAVENNPIQNDEIIRCGGARRSPAWPKISFYQKANACLESRYQQDYQNWIAQQVMKVPVMPKEFPKSIPPKFADAWKSGITELKKDVPFACYRKNDEHFADSFGAHVYARWTRMKKSTTAQLKQGLHYYAHSRCVRVVQKIKGPASNHHSYPPIEDRLELQLQPAHVREQLGCLAPANELCGITDATFHQSMTGSPGGSISVPNSSSGTKP